jgi:hypothetical protein
MRRSLLILILLLLASLSLRLSRSEAAITVIEVGAQLAHTANTSVQSTITAVQSVAMVLNQILELTDVGSFVLEGEWRQDVDLIVQLIGQGQQLAWDLASLDAQINSLFALQSAPTTAVGFNQRMGEIRIIISQSYSYAMRTQVLIMTALRTVQHLLALVARVREFIGNMTANQNLGEHVGTLTQLLTEQKVTTTVLQRAQSTEALQMPVAIESLKQINQRVMSDHPR